MHCIYRLRAYSKGKRLPISCICERVSLERPNSRACRGCLTPSPHVTRVLTLSLARSDHFALVFGTSLLLCIAVHRIASFCVILHVFHAFLRFFLSPDLIDTVATPFSLFFPLAFYLYFRCFESSFLLGPPTNSEPDSDRCTRALGSVHG